VITSLLSEKRVLKGTSDPDFDTSCLPVQENQLEKSKKGQRGIKFSVQVPSEYPQAPPKVNVLSKHPIQAYLQNQVDGFIDRNAGTKLLRPLYKWIDRKIGEWRPPVEAEEEVEVCELSPKSKSKSSQVWTLGEQILLEKALRMSIGVEKHTRWRKIAQVVGRPKRDCVNRYVYIRHKLSTRHEPAGLSTGVSAVQETALRSSGAVSTQESTPATESVVAPPSGAVSDDASTGDECIVLTAKETPRQESIEPPGEGSVAIANADPTGELSTEWSPGQQVALDQALERFPASMEKNERWKAIAKAVKGKSKKECVERYKFIRQQLLSKQEHSTPNPSQRGSLGSLDSDGQCEEELAEDEQQHDMPDLNPTEKGIKGALGSLEMLNIGWCYVTKLSLQCSCELCGTDVSMTLSPDQPFKDWCKSCSTTLSVVFHPALIHAESCGKIGYFDANVVIQDLITCSIMIGCLECTTMCELLDVRRARTSETFCRKCHTGVRLSYKGWNSQNIDAAHLNISSKQHYTKPKTKRPPKDPRIVPGKPLPNNGTCKHYRKSHRWFRFPCCGIAYPCDVCHQIKGSCDEAILANRQICGYCAAEQPFSNTHPCKKCAKVIGPPKHSSHWEGGTGCRDKTKMSSNDAQKYKNSKLKTHSKKSQRVGPKNQK